MAVTDTDGNLSEAFLGIFGHHVYDFSRFTIESTFIMAVISKAKIQRKTLLILTATTR